MIPDFPRWTTLDLRHRDILRRLNASHRYHPSDASFVNLYSWSVDDSSQVTRFGGGVLVRQTEYTNHDSNVHLWLGERLTRDHAIELVFELGSLSLLPDGAAADLHGVDCLRVVEDRDSADYLYRVSSLAALEPPVRRSRRRAARRFGSGAGTHLAVEHVAGELPVSTQHEILEVVEAWYEATWQAPRNVELERFAIRRALATAGQLGLLTSTLRIHGELIAFSIHELVDRGYAICHFEKALVSEWRDLGPVVVQEVAKQVCQVAEVVNWEQDLGMDGLRHSKLSYGPAGLLAKYSVSPAEPSLQ